MNFSRWLRHVIEHRIPQLIAGARGWLANAGATLSRVGRGYWATARRYGLIAGGVATRWFSQLPGWSQRTSAAARSAYAENTALVRRLGIGALLVAGFVTAIWIAAANSQSSPAATPVAAPVTTSTGTAAARPTSPVTTSGGNPGPAPDSVPPSKPSAPSSATSQGPSPAPAPTPAPAQPGQALGDYTVAPGDTLSGIALRHNVPFEQLASRNGIRNPNKITVGTKLSISSRLPGTEVIQPGDAVHTYTQRYGVSQEKLTVLNPELLKPPGIVKPPGLLAGGGIRIAAVLS